MSYDCPEGLIDSDEKILKMPERLEALSQAASELESFTDAAWWQANVDELNACEIHGQAGPLTAEEKENYTSGEYQFGLFGNHSIRMVVMPDSCYQTGYNGLVTFLIYRRGERVFVTKLLDGYYSRVANSVGIDFATLNGQQIIEVSTSNTMPPSVTNYYYAIDPTTHRAAPKKLFKEGKALTNEIRSAMILGEPSDLGLPRGAKDMQIISRHRLLPSFNAYAETFEGDGRKLNRTIYRWNGRFYVESNKK